MTHHKPATPHLTTGGLAVALVPAMILSAGVASLMGAKAYEMIRLANAHGKALEKASRAHD